MRENEKMHVGGQAVIEGVMMKGKKISVAVRKKNGEIVVRDYPAKLTATGIWKKTPFIRGILVLWDSLNVGIRVLNFSAEVSDEGEMSKKDIILSLFLAVGLAILLFSILPLLLTSIFKITRENDFLFSLVEGIIRAVILLVYIKIISLIPDVKRIFQYHGAEHKAVYTYENGEDLTVENARKYPTLHPRCGTSFLMITVVVSIVIFALLGVFGRLNFWGRLLSRIILIPVIAGSAYEFQRFTAKHLDNRFIRSIALPGLWLQKLTTAEPTDDQLEVALTALKSSLGLEWETFHMDVENPGYEDIQEEENRIDSPQGESEKVENYGEKDQPEENPFL